MPSLSSLNLLVTEESWEKGSKQLFDMSHWALYWVCTFFLRKAFFISSQNYFPYWWFSLFPSTLCLTIYWFCKEKLDFDHFCKLMDQKTSKLICRNYDINNSFDVHTDFCCSLNTGGSVAEWLEHRIWNLKVTWSKSCSVLFLFKSCSDRYSWCCAW